MLRLFHDDKHSTRLRIVWAAFLCAGTLALSAVPVQDVQRRDSLHRSPAATVQSHAHGEFPDFRHRMMTSPQPVEIRQQGRNLCVTSRYNQLLPIYTSSGALYSSFRLSKGTNWLSGLPRGSYIINNKKFTIN